LNLPLQTVIIHKILYSNIIHGRCIHDDNLVRRFN
jgi:hypothetical protein